jgi:flagellar basal body-associated protein FliL
MIPLDTKVVNMAPGGDYKYAKIGVTIELRPDAQAFYAMKPAEKEPLAVQKVKDMAELLPVLDDAVATVVASKTSTELLSETGRAQLKEELLAAVRAVLDGEGASASAAPAESAAPEASAAAPAESAALTAVGSKVLDLYFTDLVMQ